MSNHYASTPLPAPFVAASPGALPHDGPASIAGVDLPAGHRCPSSEAGGDAATVIWITDAPVASTGATVLALAAAFPTSGLWPIVIESLHGEPSHPSDDGEIAPADATRIDSTLVSEVLDDLWQAALADDDPEALAAHDPALAAMGADFPGMAAPSPGIDAGVVAARLGPVVASIEADPIALVPACRPADVLTVLGWLGPANYPPSPVECSSVLRSWEERFGAVLVGIGFDTLDLAVTFPPEDVSAAAAIAVEHFAFCPDNIWQGTGTIAAYAQQLVDAQVWSFWWD